MLDDAAIERWSRQILLAEVGGRGQERLGATRVRIAGEGPVADFAATLVAAAGPAVVREVAGPGVVRATIDGVTVSAAGGRVVTLVGRPCLLCAPDVLVTGDADDPAIAQALGALVAGEALRAALGLATEGRAHVVDPARGLFEARAVPPTGGCAACAGGS
jgi:hypothetical protein